MSDLVKIIEAYRGRLISILRKYGYKVPNNLKISQALDILETTDFVDQNREENYGVTLDDIGYIKDVVKIDTVIQLKYQTERKIPEDFYRGYYKLNGKKIELDEERKRLL